MPALRIYAGPRARQHIERQGLWPQDVGVVPGAAGGPKGLVLGPLDRFVFGDWLAQSQQPVDLVGAPSGAYRDGGITDYHLHLNYHATTQGLVLYPHFQKSVVPGWLDKGFKWRHGATHFLDSTIVLAPDPAWVARLPNGKLPDRRRDDASPTSRWPAALRTPAGWRCAGWSCGSGRPSRRR